MLTITTKKYEIEEPIKAEDEEHNTLYEFTMQITGEELDKINKIIEKDFNATLEIEKLVNNGKQEEAQKISEESIKMISSFKDELIDIVYKEHKEPFLKAVGEYRTNKMTEMIFDFFESAFIEEKMKRADTIITNLTKITQK